MVHYLFLRFRDRYHWVGHPPRALSIQEQWRKTRDLYAPGQHDPPVVVGESVRTTHAEYAIYSLLARLEIPDHSTGGSQWAVYQHSFVIPSQARTPTGLVRAFQQGTRATYGDWSSISSTLSVLYPVLAAFPTEEGLAFLQPWMDMTSPKVDHGEQSLAQSILIQARDSYPHVIESSLVDRSALHAAIHSRGNGGQWPSWTLLMQQHSTGGAATHPNEDHRTPTTEEPAIAPEPPRASPPDVVELIADTDELSDLDLPTPEPVELERPAVTLPPIARSENAPARGRAKRTREGLFVLASFLGVAGASMMVAAMVVVGTWGADDRVFESEHSPVTPVLVPQPNLAPAPAVAVADEALPYVEASRAAPVAAVPPASDASFSVVRDVDRVRIRIDASSACQVSRIAWSCSAAAYASNSRSVDWDPPRQGSTRRSASVSLGVGSCADNATVANQGRVAYRIQCCADASPNRCAQVASHEERL